MFRDNYVAADTYHEERPCAVHEVDKYANMEIYRYVVKFYQANRYFEMNLRNEQTLELKKISLL